MYLKSYENNLSTNISHISTTIAQEGREAREGGGRGVGVEIET